MKNMPRYLKFHTDTQTNILLRCRQIDIQLLNGTTRNTFLCNANETRFRYANSQNLVVRDIQTNIRIDRKQFLDQSRPGNHAKGE